MMIMNHLLRDGPGAGAAPDGPTFAVIPTWNCRDRIEAVIAALAGQVDGIVIVDNASRDGTAAWLATRAIAGEDADTRLPELRVLLNAENQGWPAAINLGLREAWARGAELAVLLNDDALALPGAVEALKEALARDGRIAAASARMTYLDRPDVLNGTGGEVDFRRAFAKLRGEGELDRGQHDAAPDPDYPSGAASLIRRGAWEAIGPFDEAYYLYYEDADWGLRARDLGWRIAYAPAARIMHLGSAGTARDPARRRYYNVRNRLRFARRHGSPSARLRCWAETLALAARQPARLLFPSRHRDGLAVLWAIADHLGGRYGRSRRFS